ncbi:hypothetical protein ABIA39_003211 [Nocardia sp. GAS34]|uniref:hypothetical protein n=1 Tax=unclassified Nocardia TaxID=2637762 RepID=UPI003D1B85FC
MLSSVGYSSTTDNGECGNCHLLGSPASNNKATNCSQLMQCRSGCEPSIHGVDSRKLDLAASAQRLDLLTPYFENGQFRPLPIGRTFGLDDGRDAYRAVAERVRFENATRQDRVISNTR